MSDITIPGFSNQNSTIDTEQVIEDLLELERIPLTRIESQIDEYQLEREVWLDIGRGVSQLSENSTFLFSFQNPFNERVGISGNERALTLTPERNAEESEYTIEIIQNAARDRFLSRDIERDYRVPPGRYTFEIGEEQVTINFDGGSLRAFIDEINGVNPELLTAQVIRKSDTADAILFESQLYGQDNRLLFRDDALTFAQQNEIIDYQQVEKFQSDAQYIVPAQTEERIPLTEPITPDSSSTLTFTALRPEADAQPERAGFDLPSSGSITLQDVTVPNIRSAVPLSEQEPAAIDNSRSTFIYAQLEDGSEVAVADVPTAPEPQPIEVPLADISSPITEIIIRNDNTHQTVTVSDVGINNETNDYRPLNPIEEARDAILKLDGVEVTRPTNTIDDLIPQVTIELLAEQSEKITAEVAPDYDLIKSSVLSFVGSYNQLIRDLNILARNDSEVINEIDFPTDEEQEQAEQRLGLMQGEIALTQLRTRLVTLTQNSYTTSVGREVNLLSQIGIATNVGGFNSGGVTRSRLRGYLEFDESQFDNAVKENFQAVRELFGYDSDRDLVVDSGVAYEIDRYSDLYTQNGGVIQIRTGGLDGRIERSNDQLSTYNRRLEAYERELRSDFGRMQGALDSLDNTTRSLEGLQNQ